MTATTSAEDVCLTAQEVADMLRLSPSYVYTLARRTRKGHPETGMPCHFIGKYPRFSKNEVMEWFATK